MLELGWGQLSALVNAIQFGPTHTDVILSLRRDTMYHIDVIHVFRTFLDTEKNTWQTFSL